MANILGFSRPRSFSALPRHDDLELKVAPSCAMLAGRIGWGQRLIRDAVRGAVTALGRRSTADTHRADDLKGAVLVNFKHMLGAALCGWVKRSPGERSLTLRAPRPGKERP